jgi:hypothetical protein
MIDVINILELAPPFQFAIAPIPVRIAVTRQPAGAVVGVPFAVQPVVTLLDAFGNPVIDSADTVTAARGFGTGVLGGPLTVTMVNGVATFSGLLYDRVGTFDIVFTTSAGAFTATSNYITCTLATSQPTYGPGIVWRLRREDEQARIKKERERLRRIRRRREEELLAVLEGASACAW